jgi:acetolactate synthase-1/2/3 large subunit
LQARESAREDGIAAEAAAPAASGVNPLRLLKDLDGLLPDNSVVVADGGDFVATASYIVRPRSALRWLDPGVYGTLGVGAGFALGAKLCRPDDEVWALFGDGAFGYSLSEFDTFVRHGIALVAVVGNDACWNQIAREQVEIFQDDVGCPLRASDYHLAAAGLGAKGFAIRAPAETVPTLQAARAAAAAGAPVLVNAILGKTDFRKGSISM